MKARDVRSILGQDKIIGVSAQTVEQALLAQEQGADYLGVGAVFPTGSKDDAVEVDHQVLARICQAVDIPVIAIGGITADNVVSLKGKRDLRDCRHQRHFRQAGCGGGGPQPAGADSGDASGMMKGAIFDVDGVLLDSMEEWDRLGETYLAGLGIRAEEGLADTLAAMSMEEGAAWLIRHYGLSKTVEQAVEEMAGVMREAYACRIPEKNGVENYLRGLAEAGIPMVIATSGDRDNARMALERLGLWKYFRGMLHLHPGGRRKESAGYLSCGGKDSGRCAGGNLGV